jgi:excisionase family DNA binding protein
MQAYAPAETARPVQLRILDSPAAAAAAGVGLLDELVGQLADLVADRVAARLAAPRRDDSDEWLDTRRASEYLGIHRDSLRRLAAERSIPTEQAGAGCKLYFRRSDLDDWRYSGSAPLVSIGGGRNG